MAKNELDEKELKTLLSKFSLLNPAKGRMQLVSELPNRAKIFIDFAHSPDALQNVLSLAQGLTNQRIIVLFGCGGNRDAAKRPIMGRIACELADVVIVTDDNPRLENPAAIRSEILSACDVRTCSKSFTSSSGYFAASNFKKFSSDIPNLIEDTKLFKKIKTIADAPIHLARRDSINHKFDCKSNLIIEIPDRKTAIEKAVGMLEAGDVLILAGKGHEKYQIIGDQKFEFDEEFIVKNAIEEFLKSKI